METYRLLTVLICTWRLANAASQRCSMEASGLCTVPAKPQTSGFYDLQLSSQEYSTTENGKMQLSVQVKTTRCPTLQTPGPKYYKLEAYSKSKSEPAGTFNDPFTSSEAELCTENEIVFSSCDPKVTDLPRTYGWNVPAEYVGDICFRLTILKDGDETCEQVVKCISPDISASGDYSDEKKDDELEPQQASGDKDGNMLQPVSVVELTEVAVHGSSHEESCYRRRNCTGARMRLMCGTDGKEYPSRCHVRLEACLTGTNIEVHHRGECQTPSPPPTEAPGPCFEERRVIMSSPAAISFGWIPSCDCNGYHKPVQCNTVTNECWCSNKHGAQSGDRQPFTCEKLDFSSCLYGT